MLTSLLCCLLLSDATEAPATAKDIAPPAASAAPLQPVPVPEGQGAAAPGAESAEAKAFPVDSFLKQHDADGDGKLSPAELPRRFFKKFAETDLDNDGFLTGQELLFANNRIGRQARKADKLRLQPDGTVIAQGNNESAQAALQVAGELLQQLDFNQDGFVDSNEIKYGMQNPRFLLARGLSMAAALAESNLPPPVAPGEEPGATQPIPPDAAPGATPPAPGQQPLSKSAAPAPKSGKPGKAEFPPPADIVKALDHNNNGLVDSDEAIDDLAKNFRMLDKDKNGGLSEAEIDRGLRLARMFGIKPKTSYYPPGEEPKAQPTKPATPAAPANSKPAPSQGEPL